MSRLDHPLSSEATSGMGMLSRKFERLKSDFRAQFGTSFDLLRDTAIYDTPLYKFLERMPKGADLHAHADAILPMDMQVEFLKDHPELVITPEWEIRFIGPGAPYGSRTMQECLDDGLTVDDFRRNWTVAGAPRNGYVWDWFEGIFTKCGAICITPALVQDYYTRVMLYYHSIGVEHLELRSPFFGTRQDAQARAEAYIRALAEVRKVAPVFTLSIIACAGKNDAWDPLFDLLIDNAVWVWKNVKDGKYDLVKAIDIVNDEDRSYSLARYEDRIRKVIVENPGLRLTLHAGESLRGENEEIAIAIRCGIDRLGHGFNLYRYPHLEKAVLEKGIPMEICPVSNAALGYCRDFAKHPAKQYMESGIPIIICSDDAAYQARSVLTGDYLAVAVGWDLSLAQIRQLCRISIENSFLIPARKQVLRNWFKGAWKQFENKI